MNIAKLVFNPFQENTYVLWDDTNECVIVDAGNYSSHEHNSLINFLNERKLKPVMLLNTHGHVDHMLGVATLKAEYGIPFALHGEDKFLIDSAKTHGEIYGFKITEIPAVDIDLKDNEEIQFGNTTLKIIHTPGHTPGHICLYEEGAKILLSGDTLFRESIGRTDLPGGDYGWIMRSIIDRLIPLGDDVKVYPGHGPESSIGHEVLYNPFITEIINGEVHFE